MAHHQDLVYGMALRLTGRPADAEDLAQETFLRAYRALSGYPHDRVAGLRPRGWLAAIALNLARNRVRGRRRSEGGRVHEPLDHVGADEGRHPLDDPRLEPASVAERRESAREWRARLDTLPASYRQAVELRHVEGLSYPELAEALGRPVGTVKSDVHRGVALLRRVLEAEARMASGSEGRA
jgi:RNA polymerase sigma-70 factor (ECF subfamily)